MADNNTGRKIYGTLTQVYVDSGEPTGEAVRDNLPEDPFYIPPVEDIENCPPPTSITYVNQLLIEVINNSTQSIYFSNAIVKPYSQSTNYNNDDISLLPLQSKQLFNNNQLDDITKVIWTTRGLSLSRRVTATFFYKRSDESSFTELQAFDQYIDSTLNVDLSTSRVNDTNDTNNLRIIITDNPVPDPPVNIPPVADAGANFSSELNIVTLTGSASDADGSIISHVWSQISGPNTPNINTPTSLTTTVSDLIVGIYVFKLTVTDNLGATDEDTVQVEIVAPTVSNIGTLNVYVDEGLTQEIEGVGYSIADVVLRQVGFPDLSLLFDPIDETSGVVALSPIKRTCSVAVAITTPDATPRLLKVQWTGHTVLINVMHSGTYVVNNVVIGSGVDGVTISLLAIPTLTPTFDIKFLRLTVGASQVENTPTLPWGLSQITRATVQADVYSDYAGTVAADYEGIIDATLTVTDNLTSTATEEKITRSVPTPSNSVVIDDILAQKEWDYTLNDPGAVDSEDLYEDVTFEYELVPGQGYLVIA